MHLRSFVVGVGLVATTNALLLPPDLAITDDDSITTLPVPIKTDIDAALQKVPDSQTLNLECPGCLQFGRKHHKDIPSHLKLDFSIDSTRGADRLTVNGFELYPNPDPLRYTLAAPVLPDMTERRIGAPPRFRGGLDRPQKNRPLGYAMQTGVVATDDDEDLQLINVEIQIVEVGNVFIERIPNVQVQLVKSPSGKLAIGTINTIDSRTEDAAGKQKECATTVCRWKAVFFEKLSQIMKSCSGSRAGPPSPHHHGEHRHGHGPHPHHMGHGHGWGRVVRSFMTNLLLPALIGITIGVSASIIGFLLGHFIVFLWRTFVRRPCARSSHRCRYARKAAEHERGADEEKSGLLSGQEVEAPPAYVASTVAVSEDKKPANDA